ncbi:Activating signal cointegrator 1 complex subunit 1 [Senna tora]|uniref:Activating signal cointegrator 1 complex subunit 1 n=1 Tax=Senna tora TaxID=362788 RepID=A0A834XFE6_9FABA|nr:Activating signal cointegrator 1 complex subunit 1 [Senna tora]
MNQGQSSYHHLSCNLVMHGRKKKLCIEDHNKKQKILNPVWRPVTTHASACQDGGDVQELGSSKSSTFTNDQVIKVAAEGMTELIESDITSSLLQDNVENKVLEGSLAVSSGKHSISVEVGASLFRFIKGKGGSTQKNIEEEMGVKIIIPSSKEEDFVTIEGISNDSVTLASKKIQAIIDEVVKSRNLDYSHFISLPLAIHPELVNRLVSFQNSILGTGDSCMDENLDTDANEETTDNEELDELSKEEPNVAVELKVKDSNESVEVNLTNIPLVSYAPKASKSSALSDLGIDKSIFIKPKTFHLTVLMLKLWNKDRVKKATEVLQNISSSVKEALDNRPLSVKLKGLDCMKGSLAKARVLYAPVEEIGSEGRLQRACQVIIDAFVEAGLVLENDANQKLKLHATVMNARHRKRSKLRKKKVDSFDARGIFKQYGSEDWGEYPIREVHLSQRFSFDENGYYHCCASIPFPENMQVE